LLTGKRALSFVLSHVAQVFSMRSALLDPLTDDPLNPYVEQGAVKVTSGVSFCARCDLANSPYDHVPDVGRT
jgi:hypothetical protein